MSEDSRVSFMQPSPNGFVRCEYCGSCLAEVGHFRRGKHGILLWKCDEERPHIHVRCLTCDGEFLMAPSDEDPDAED